MMKIHYSLAAEDYREYQQTYITQITGFWEKYHFRTFVTFGIITLVAGLNWIFLEHRQGYPGFVSIVGGLYLIFTGVWGRLRWKRWFQSNKHLYEDLEAEVTEDDLTLRTRTVETCAKWEHYSRFVESPNLLILLDRLGNWLLLPKRAFAPADLDSFIQILHKKVGRSEN